MTLVTVFTIPWYGNASIYVFGDGRFYLLLDCHLGYHQVLVNKRLRPKLAFARSRASMMYTYDVLPLSPLNGPVISIHMMFNINGDRQLMAIDNSVSINDNTNTTITVEDYFNWTISKDQEILYMETQFTVAARRHLSFSLPKSLFFPSRVKFVGINTGTEFNMPAASKFEILRT